MLLLSQLDANLNTALLRLIEQERNGEQIKANLLSCVVSSYFELGCDDAADQAPPPYSNQRQPESAKHGVYKRYFEAPFLQATQQYYAEESATFIQRHSMTDYFRKVRCILFESFASCTHFSG